MSWFLPGVTLLQMRRLNGNVPDYPSDVPKISWGVATVLNLPLNRYWNARLQGSAPSPIKNTLIYFDLPGLSTGRWGPGVFEK